MAGAHPFEKKTTRMKVLQLPVFDAKIKYDANRAYIFDIVRHKYVLLTPEEWVRQHFLNYLVHHLYFPKGLCRLEKKIQGTKDVQSRPDIVFYDTMGKAKMIIECKSSDTPCLDETLGQLMKYARQMPVKALVYTNGIEHFCWKLDLKMRKYCAIDYIPTYKEFLHW